MPVTTKEIAKICGVSRGSVDRALNNRPGINTRTRDKILKTAQELGNQPDFLGKSLVTGKTMTIGVVVFDVYSRFFGQLVHAIECRAKELGYFVYLTLTDKDTEVEKQCIEHLRSRKVDGLILFPVNKGSSFKKFIESIQSPIVTIVNKIDSEMDYVGINDYKATSDAVKLLREYNHTNIVYVTTHTQTKKHLNMYAVEQRLRGFVSACKELGIPEYSGNIIEAGDYPKVVLKKLQQPDPPTAILCSNDIYALEIMKYLKDNGINIPNDVSLMGFDNIDALQYIEPGLTTISYPVEELGSRAVDILVDKITNAGNHTAQNLLLEHKLIERNSISMI